MTFEAQESALLALLFDRELREAFARDRAEALAAFELDERERADFDSVRLGGLELDAKLRSDLMLARLCRSLPLSFSLASAFDPGLLSARRLLSSRFFLTPAHERTARYAEQLEQTVLAALPSDEPQRALIEVLLKLELGLSRLSSAARQAALTGQLGPDPTLELCFGWERLRLALAPFTGAFMLPRSYRELLSELCPGPADQLWTRLSVAPLPRSRLRHVLADERPRLLIVRAVFEPSLPIDATIRQRTVELAAGFAPLITHLAAGQSAEQVLEGLRRSGAKAALLESIAKGILRLIEEQMLQPARR